jgi:hypothetical protein
MYDTRTYIATKDLAGGPVYIDERFTIEYQMMNPPLEADARPLTAGRLIGGIISLALLGGTGIYFLLVL